MKTNMNKKMMGAMDLTAYMASKICHDLISPAGAIMNGLEVLSDEESSDMHDFAIDLIRKSAIQTSARLQFARMAYGASGGKGKSLDVADAESVARGYLETEKLSLNWHSPKVLLDKNEIKFLLNMLVIAQGVIPRGGVIDVTIDVEEGADKSSALKINCTGMNSRITKALEDAAKVLELDENDVDAHSIQPYYTGLLAVECGLEISCSQANDTIEILAKKNNNYK